MAAEGARHAVKALYRAASADLGELQEWVSNSKAMANAHQELKVCRAELNWMRNQLQQQYQDSSIQYNNNNNNNNGAGQDECASSHEQRHATNAQVAVRCADTRLAELDVMLETTDALETSQGRSAWVMNVRRLSAAVSVAKERVHAMTGAKGKDAREHQRRGQVAEWRKQVREVIIANRQQQQHQQQQQQRSNKSDHNSLRSSRDGSRQSKFVVPAATAAVVVETKRGIKECTKARKLAVDIDYSSTAAGQTKTILRSVNKLKDPRMTTTTQPRERCSSQPKATSPRGSNWRSKHVKVGKMDNQTTNAPSKADELLARVERMRRELARD
jgi:hypothetical protein